MRNKLNPIILFQVRDMPMFLSDANVRYCACVFVFLGGVLCVLCQWLSEYMDVACAHRESNHIPGSYTSV